MPGPCPFILKFMDPPLISVINRNPVASEDTVLLTAVLWHLKYEYISNSCVTTVHVWFPDSTFWRTLTFSFLWSKAPHERRSSPCPAPHYTGEGHSSPCCTYIDSGRRLSKGNITNYKTLDWTSDTMVCIHVTLKAKEMLAYFFLQKQTVWYYRFIKR